MNTIRKEWIDTLFKIASPVLSLMAQDKLKKTMIVEEKIPDRDKVTYLEALGRTISGISAFIENPCTDKTEEKLRLKLALYARDAIKNAVNDKANDKCDFTNKISSQPLVDAAFLAHGLIRAPKELFEKLDEKTKENLIFAFKQTRSITPFENNWLLFSAMIEAFLYFSTGECDINKVIYALEKHEKWYKGDGVYGDGEMFKFDYYNSYVIQPMLLDITNILYPIIEKYGYSDEYKEKLLIRAQRYSVILEKLIAPDGTFPAVGRSLAYRTGAFQILSQIVLMNKLPNCISYAQVRCALTNVIRKCFESDDNFDEKGFLKIGICSYQPSLGENYIATGSLYLCTTVFLPLGLSENHPFWKDADEMYTSQKVWSGIDVCSDKSIK